MRMALPQCFAFKYTTEDFEMVCLLRFEVSLDWPGRRLRRSAIARQMDIPGGQPSMTQPIA